MSDSIGKVQLDLETNSAPFQQQLRGIAGKSTNMVKSAFLGLGKVLGTAFAITKLVQFGKASIDMASDLQEVQNVVDVVFGESSNQINNFAKNALTSYGLSELSAKQYASTMGAMLKSMGLSQQATLDMSQAITGLAGDMASFYNLDTDEAFAKIRAGISGETEPLKQLGINMSVANMEAYAMSQGITKAYKSMTQSEQALLRYNYLLSTTSDAQGDFARTTNSWANQTRILKEQFNSLMATLGSAFISVLTPVIKMLNWLISKLQIAAAYFKAFIEALTGVKGETGSASSGMTEIADSATEAGDATVAAAKKAKNALAGFDQLNVLSQSGDEDSGSSGGSGGDFATPTMPEIDLGVTVPEPDSSGVQKAADKVKSIFNLLKNSVVSGAQGIYTYFTTTFAPSISAWGTAFASLQEPIATAFTSIWESTQGLWNDTLAPFGMYLVEDFIPTLTNNFSENFAPIFSDVMSWSVKQFAADFQWMCDEVNRGVTDIITPAMETIKTVTTDVTSAIGKEWSESGKGLLELFSGVIDTFKGIWNSFYENVLKPVWDNIINAIDWLWDKHLKGLWENVLSFFTSLGECVMTIWNNFLGPLVQWIISVLGPIVTGIINHIVDVVMTVVSIIADVVSGILKALGGLLDFITGVFSGDWEKAWQGICDFFKGIWDAIWGIIKGIINLIIDGLNSVWTGVYNFVKGIINGIGGIAGAIGDIFGQDWHFSMPSKPAKIPKLAEGGIIDQPTLAMVGEAGKEAVVPLENTAFADSIANAILKVLTPLFANGGGINKNSDGTTVIVLKVGEYELGRISVGAINKYHNVIGKVELEV